MFSTFASLCFLDIKALAEFANGWEYILLDMMNFVKNDYLRESGFGLKSSLARDKFVFSSHLSIVFRIFDSCRLSIAGK